MQQMVPEAPTEMIVKARSWMHERSMGSRSDALAEPVLDDYRACLKGLKAIEVYVNEDHSEAEAQRIVDEDLHALLPTRSIARVAAELSTQLRVLMIKLTPDAETKIITVIRPWFLDDSDKGLGDSINIKRSRPCQGGARS
jgi:hypothetical protein